MSISDTAKTFKFTATQDWFSHNIESWTSLCRLVKSKTPKALEIGSWEGRSAVFLLRNLCKDGGEIVCIDHFDQLQTEAGRERFERMNHNLALTGKKHRIMAEFSAPALMKILEEEMTSNDPGFDWVYVDGSHEADDTFLDGELAWRLAKKDAIIIFDDFHWGKEPEDSIHHPKRGIDAFLMLHQGEYERLANASQYQAIVRKNVDMRIGFLTANKSHNKLNETLGYGIHIALAVDVGYTIGAAVTMRSAAATTSGRITFYVIDCGLSVVNRDWVQISASIRPDVTIKFIPLPKDGLAGELNLVWAKIDMLRTLPVKRVLYLDADLLVRSSLNELWETDLGNRRIAAVPDVGHPMGHEGDDRAPYFNAGVLLLDSLTKIRADIDGLEATARTMKNSRFRDQDALNVHFRSWLPLSLKWNAQGLGTYAKYPSKDRDKLRLSEMDNPSIVHFTGPVHPTLAEVLNPYVQPPTAKPWGYVGAPGHPFATEWWTVLENTPFENIRKTENWKLLKSSAMSKAIDAAIKDFTDRLE